MTSPAPLAPHPNRESLYEEAVRDHGGALVRLARSYELDADKRQDLLQEIHLALWTSFATFDGRCSLRTWVYRVAHNVATSHVIKDRRRRGRTFVSLDALASTADDADTETVADRRLMLDRLLALLQQLDPLDRQVMLLYLEGVDAASIGEITGLSSGNVATKVHRIKKVLGRRARAAEGGSDAP
jgi:RNA polymerase sigma-70 factor, ECF subfamily